jgi:DNA-binding beta-propeller fold protein YncE
VAAALMVAGFSGVAVTAAGADAAPVPTIIATISVGAPYAVAVNPAGTYAYVTNAADGTLSVIDLATNTVTARSPPAPNRAGSRSTWPGPTPTPSSPPTAPSTPN